MKLTPSFMFLFIKALVLNRFWDHFLKGAQKVAQNEK